MHVLRTITKARRAFASPLDPAGYWRRQWRWTCGAMAARCNHMHAAGSSRGDAMEAAVYAPFLPLGLNFISPIGVNGKYNFRRLGTWWVLHGYSHEYLRTKVITSWYDIHMVPPLGSPGFAHRVHQGFTFRVQEPSGFSPGTGPLAGNRRGAFPSIP